MRELLLAILICCLSHLAFGQSNMQDSCWQERILYGVGIADASVDTGCYTPHEIHMKLWFISNFQPLVEAWEMYEAECWADSTTQENPYQLWTDFMTGEVDSNSVMFVTSDPRFNTLAVVKRLPRYYYTHRDPTFPGIMEFLKMKVKP